MIPIILIMARAKAYNEGEVVEKAMQVFWQKGYTNTSMQLLEKEMGINKFSIYSSFGNKNGLFLESLKCYKQKISHLNSTLKSSSQGLDAIKTYFYDFLEFSKATAFGKGCLVTNTANELDQDSDEQIKEALFLFTQEVKQLFASVLEQEGTTPAERIEQHADYLLISMFGLSSASRRCTKTQLQHHIETVFKNL